MKAALLALFALLKPPFVRLLSSMKFWTVVLGIATTQAAKYGLEVDEKTYWTIVGMFGLLLGGQAAADHGKEAAKAKQAGFARLEAMLVLVAIGTLVIGCGASVREKTLRATFVTATTAQAGFVSWDLEHQRDLLAHASSREELDAAVAEYRKRREPVIQAFTAVYRVISSAALLDEMSVTSAVTAAEQLQQALHALTGRSWP